jgi:hypothetical protein
MGNLLAEHPQANPVVVEGLRSGFLQLCEAIELARADPRVGEFLCEMPSKWNGTLNELLDAARAVLSVN